MDEKTGNYWKILETTLDWIKYSDAKATGILSIFGIIVTVIYSNIEPIKHLLMGNVYLGVLSVLSAICSLIAISYAFRSISPRIVKSNDQSIVFFGSVVRQYASLEEYRSMANKILDSKDGLDNELAEQIYINSSIAAKKFGDVTRSIRFFVVGMFLILLEIMIYMVIQM